VKDAKYIGLDVHQATISAAVLDSSGKLVMECILETKVATILQFVHELRGSLHVTLEDLRDVDARFAQAPRHRSAALKLLCEPAGKLWSLYSGPEPGELIPN
jgi:hypothetical protein